MKLTDLLLLGAFAYLWFNPISGNVADNPAQTSLRSWEALVGQGMLDVAGGIRSGSITTETQFNQASGERSKEAFNMAWEAGVAKAMAEAFPKGKDAQGNDVSSWTANKAADLYEQWGKQILEHAGE